MTTTTYSGSRARKFTGRKQAIYQSRRLVSEELGLSVTVDRQLDSFLAIAGPHPLKSRPHRKKQGMLCIAGDSRPPIKVIQVGRHMQKRHSVTYVL